MIISILDTADNPESEFRQYGTQFIKDGREYALPEKGNTIKKQQAQEKILRLLFFCRGRRDGRYR